MTKTYWPRVEELFHELVDVEASERASILSEESEEVRAAVLRLFGVTASDALISATVRRAARLVTQPEKRIGAYEIVRELGHGGMGAVYLGQRADATYEKQVAIKFVRSGMDSPLLRERFEAERRILARLEHPYIARLLDAGAAENGQPYFVMEYIEGEAVAQWANTRQIPLRGRIELFVKVCEAVRYAHQHLVVHRDLKPSNILVTADGTPKLLDFGIAKLMEHEGGDTQSTVLRVLTPDYASPEQARGDAVSVASDVYSLGAVLYELLTGAPPFRLDGLSPAESERRVCEVEVARPSLKAPHLRGDLDNILLKTLRKAPAERYAGVEELRADLARYLEGKPVEARQYTWRQRFGKWVRRNRAMTLASAAIVLSLFAGSGLALWSAHEAQAARDVAERERQRAELKSGEAERKAVEALEQRKIAETQRGLADHRFEEQRQLFGDSLREYYGMVERLPGSTQARLQLLTLAAKAEEKLAADAPDDPRIQVDLASYYERLGDLMGAAQVANMGDRQAAMAHYQKSLAIIARAQKLNPSDLSLWRALAGIHLRIAALQAFTAENPKVAVETAKQAVQEAEFVLRANPKDVKARRLLVDTLLLPQSAIYRREAVLADFNQLDRAEHILRQTLEGQPTDLEAKSSLALVLSLQGSYLLKQLSFAAALERLGQVKTMREELVTSKPNDTETKRGLMMTNGHIADLYTRMNRTADPGSYAAHEAMAKLGEDLARADPDNATAQYDFAMSLTRVAVFHRRMKDYPKSIAAAEKSLSILEVLRKGESQNRVFLQQYLGALTNLGDTYRDSGMRRDALASYERQVREVEALGSVNEDAQTSIFQMRADQRLAVALAEGKDNRAVEYATRLSGKAREVIAATRKDDLNYVRAVQYLGDAGLVLEQFATIQGNLSLLAKAREALERSLAVAAEIDPKKYADWSENDRIKIRKALDQANATLRMK